MDYKEALKKLTSNELISLLKNVEQNQTKSEIDSESFDLESFPLSHGQNRIWYQQLLEDNKSLFNNPLGIHIKLNRALDLKRFEKVVNDITKRHEILRTTFHLMEDKPMQKVWPSMKISIRYKNLCQTSAAQPLAQAKELANKEACEEFDLETGPLLRFSVYQIADYEYVFLLVTHHLISDGWSNNLFFMELTRGLFFLENALSVVQYRNFVSWEQKYLQQESITRQLAFWKNQLHGDLPNTQIQPLAPKLKNQDQESTQESFILDSQLCKKITSFSKQRGITPFVTLLAAFKVLLYRYTGEKDLLIGLPIANRKTYQFQETLGLFINLVPFRYKINPGSSYSSCVEDIDEISKNIFLNSDLPFDLLIQKLNLKKHSSYNPLFNILFVLQNFPNAYAVPEVSVSPFPIDIGNSQFPLTFIIDEYKDGFIIRIKFKKQLYNTQFIHSLIQHYKKLLSKVLEQPSQQISTISMLSEKEQKWLLDKAIHPHQEIVKQNTNPIPLFLESFAFQVKRNPHSISVESNDTCLSYKELNEESNQFANYLFEKQVKPGSLIAFNMERSCEAVCVLIAILKLGCAFVPIDPSWPIERQKYVLHKSQATLLIVDSPKKNDNLLDFCSIIVLSQEREKIDLFKIENIKIEVPQSSLAYVIFTSGTTGSPKGVAVEHRQIAYYLASICYEIKPFAIKRFGFSSSFAVDMGFTNIFVPLAEGQIVNIIPEEISRDPDDLSKYLKKTSIDCLKFTPTQLTFLLKSQTPEYIIPKKLLVLAGEPTSYSLIQKVHNLNKYKCKIIISYGPTEATVGVLTLSEPEKKPWQEHPFLGHPNLYSEIYILDENHQLVPPGVLGEIFIGGQTIARGYLNPRENDNRFIHNRFSKKTVDRLYSSGDLARYLPTGELEFHGRKDRQIKIRGYRVELQEIETILENDPNVNRALVLYFGDRNSEKLAAFITANGEINKEKLKNRLHNLLPTYMIPSSFTILDSFPQTLSGKIDQESLKQLNPKIESNMNQMPRDAIELTMQGIWNEVLQIDGIGIEESFFSLGGHSFLALDLILKINRAFHVSIPLSILFENDTIKKLSDQIRKKSSKPYEQALVKIRKREKHALQFYVHPSGGQVLCYYDLAHNIKNAASIYGLQSPFMKEEDSRRYSSIEKISEEYFREIKNHFVDLRTTKTFYGGWSLGGLIAYQMATISQKELGQSPPVVILDQPVPHSIHGGIVQDDDLSFLLRFLKQVENFNNIDLQISHSELVGKNFSEQSRKIHRQFINKGLLSNEIDGLDFEKFLGIQKMTSSASKEYQPQLYTGNVLLVRAMESQWKEENDFSLGWAAIAPKLSIQWISGTHINMMQKPNISKLAAIIDLWCSKL